MNAIKKIFFIALMICTFAVITSYAVVTGKVNTEGTRLRSETNTSSSVVTVIAKGEVVQILETKDNWYKVKYDKYELAWTDYEITNEPNVIDK